MAYSDTHSKGIGYLLWIFGSWRSRFYYGKTHHRTNLPFLPWVCLHRLGLWYSFS